MSHLNYWKQTLKMQRIQKDDFFKNHPQSPIPKTERHNFNHLDYFDPDETYRFELPLQELEKIERIKINDSGGQTRNMLIWGKFTFSINGNQYTLQAYKNNTGEARLFIPFKDKTNSKATYGAGKYLDLYYENDQLENGNWIVDFNKSTNPWCAYSEKYACPLVPPANHLNVEILAGEKSYSIE